MLHTLCMLRRALDAVSRCTRCACDPCGLWCASAAALRARIPPGRARRALHAAPAGSVHAAPAALQVALIISLGALPKEFTGIFPAVEGEADRVVKNW